jgi:polyphenol oxidase
MGRTTPAGAPEPVPTASGSAPAETAPTPHASAGTVRSGPVRTAGDPAAAAPPRWRAHFAFTDRWGGVSAAPYAELNLGGAVGDDPRAVHANRARAAARLGLDPAHVVWMNQVHGRDVVVVDGPWGENPAPRADAVVTTRPGLALAVLTADCTPVLLADPVAPVIAAVHAGRPGVVAGVVPAAVRAMVELGAEPARIKARTGPAVCGRCYEVPEAMRAEIAAVEPAAYAVTSWGTPAVDVIGAVHDQLDRLGVRDRERSTACTMESADHFSYRRERTTGRLAGYVWLD